MELTAAGYYVIPRYMGWEEFLEQTRAVLDCGNHMYIQFSMKEIAKGVLFFVFLDTSESRRYYYARRTTKLRIVTDSETGEQKYLLDHIKAMYID